MLKRAEWEIERIQRVIDGLVGYYIERGKIRNVESDIHVFMSGCWSGLYAQEQGYLINEGFDLFSKEVEESFKGYGEEIVRYMLGVLWMGYEEGYLMNVDVLLGQERMIH